MNFSQRLIKNITSLTSSFLIFAGASFIFGIFIARYLGDVEFGKFSFASSFVSLFTFISNLGIETIIVRDIVLDTTRTKRYFSNILILKLLMALVTFLLIFLVINLINNDPEVKLVVYLLSIGAITMTFFGVCRAIFRSFEKIEWNLLASIIGGVSLLAGGIIALWLGYGIVVAAAIYAVANIITFGISLGIVIKKFTGVYLAIELKFWKNILVQSVPFAINGFLYPISQRIDTVLLSLFTNAASVGWYNAAYTLSFAPFSLLATGFAGAIFPSVVHLHATDKTLYNTFIQRVFRYSAVLLFPAGTIMTILAANLVDIIFGSQFVNAATALQVLIWGSIIFFINMLFINIMEATGMQKKATFILLTNAVVLTALNLFLIPILGFMGSAITELVTQIMSLCIGCIILRHSIRIRGLIISWTRPIIASVPMGVFLFYFQHFNIIVLTILAVIIYILMLYLLRGIRKEELKMIRDVINSQ